MLHANPCTNKIEKWQQKVLESALHSNRSLGFSVFIIPRESLLPLTATCSLHLIERKKSPSWCPWVKIPLQQLPRRTYSEASRQAIITPLAVQSKSQHFLEKRIWGQNTFWQPSTCWKSITCVETRATSSGLSAAEAFHCADTQESQRLLLQNLASSD